MELPRVPRKAVPWASPVNFPFPFACTNPQEEKEPSNNKFIQTSPPPAAWPPLWAEYPPGLPTILFKKLSTSTSLQPNRFEEPVRFARIRRGCLRTCGTSSVLCLQCVCRALGHVSESFRQNAKTFFDIKREFENRKNKTLLKNNNQGKPHCITGGVPSAFLRGTGKR